MFRERMRRLAALEGASLVRSEQVCRIAIYDVDEGVYTLDGVIIDAVTWDAAKADHRIIIADDPAPEGPR